jgi:hypothetical protein
MRSSARASVATLRFDLERTSSTRTGAGERGEDLLDRIMPSIARGQRGDRHHHDRSRVDSVTERRTPPSADPPEIPITANRSILWSASDTTLAGQSTKRRPLESTQSSPAGIRTDERIPLKNRSVVDYGCGGTPVP